MTKMKIYPDSHVELSHFISNNYDNVMDITSLGFYGIFIKRVIADMNIQPDDAIMDLGCGTGRNAELIHRYLNKNGSITGLDISELMKSQFTRRFRNIRQVEFLQQRIDIPFELSRSFDKVFISFVIHGFPNEVRHVVIQNAYNHLKPGGSFFILDFSEFDINAIHWLHRLIFKTIECKYAFDFIRRDWKSLLSKHGFDDFVEHYYVMKYVRLLRALKKK
ncbi:MAG: class I SAM-dependent methyltransferase [Lentisphaerae bacterium]|nr:class I SAM-dependent methyltransferase [Lentisphaerota bacterium]